MDSSSGEESDSSKSEINEWKEKPYEQLRSVIQKANHLALAKYLEVDLVGEIDHTLHPTVPQPQTVNQTSEQSDLYVWPWMGIITNIVAESNDNDNKKHWNEKQTQPDPNNYDWAVCADDYCSNGPIGEYLRKVGKLQTISDTVQESAKDRNKAVANLTIKLDMTNEIWMNYKCLRRKTSYTLPSLKNNERSNSLQLASLEQKKADENVLRLVEEQKVVHLREKKEALKKILQLEKQLDVKQKLEIGIDDLKGKLQVVKHLGQDDATVQKKMEEMNNELKEKIEDLQDLELTNQALIYKERQSNDELQEAQKVLTLGLQELLGARTNIGLKRMGELDLKAFRMLEWGEEIYETVVIALKELNEYNLCGRYVMPKLWNFKENSKQKSNIEGGYMNQEWFRTWHWGNMAMELHNILLDL
ncbi:hypothetical protein DITRI_Ditri19aG0128600 [Diplodiscus trichospermus]